GDYFHWAIAPYTAWKTIIPGRIFPCGKKILSAFTHLQLLPIEISGCHTDSHCPTRELILKFTTMVPGTTWWNPMNCIPFLIGIMKEIYGCKLTKGFAKK